MTNSRRRQAGQISNLGSQNPNDRPDVNYGRARRRPVNRNAGAELENPASQQITFRRNMNAKDVKIAIAMIEDEAGFKKLSLSEKMLEIIKKGEPAMKEWYYDKRIEGDLPATWEGVMEVVIEYCTDDDLSSQRRYATEPWHKYIHRLKDWSRYRQIPEEKVLEKLRKDRDPWGMKMILLSAQHTLTELAARVKDWEDERENRDIRKDLSLNRRPIREQQKAGAK